MQPHAVTVPVITSVPVDLHSGPKMTAGKGHVGRSRFPFAAAILKRPRTICKVLCRNISPLSYVSGPGVPPRVKY
jgi:hypothetical protein